MRTDLTDSAVQQCEERTGRHSSQDQ